MDLRFFRFMKRFRGLVPADTPLEEISVQDIDLAFIKTISTMDIFEFMNFVADETQQHELNPAAQILQPENFFGYLSVHEACSNPTRPKT